MNRENIIEMWKRSGGVEIVGMPFSKIEAFAVLVAAAEREKINDEAKAHLQELRNNFDVESPELRLHKWTRGQA